MFNMLVVIRKLVIGFFVSVEVSQDDIIVVKVLLEIIGDVILVEEWYFDVVMVIVGSGLVYVYCYIEVMEKVV